MSRFLSPEWLDELSAALANAGEGRSGSLPAGKQHLAVRQVITGGPVGDTSFVIRTGGGKATLDRGAPELVDVEVCQDFATAVEIATGKLSPSAAFASGRIKLTGRVSLLAEHQEALASLGDPFATLRSTTSY